MAEPRTRAGLDLDENLPFQRREWRVSKILWLVLLLVMIATGLGLFGDGPLSGARAGERGDPLWVEYARFGRYGASVRLTVHAAPEADGSIRFTLSRTLLDAFRVNAVTPNPAATRVSDSGVEYRFEAVPGSGAPVIFELQPAQRWLVRGTVATPARVVELTQFIYP